ncbi:major facilitator family transporter [Legionella birminghamensis]|uniref:Major facilitator family transporter n=1 Tax=Legionella birminghamensis TaxID=28083 RepID=A0A378I733_9GAMM|nr:MFS transporter [Legionella birminghamensis]KTC72423.1 major facilitator family transporter [Legionella birminghamensis]STX30555.1 major facilitator family transporter [Legionella birminghamensis]
MTFNKLRPFLMWLFPLAFFTYQFILRLWPGLMMQPIMSRFSVDASQFGLLAALYYYGYAGMQIPVAIMLEKWDARRVVSGFAILCGFAALLFSFTTNWYLACLSRFLIGAGSAVGFLGVSKVVSEWFPASQYSRMISFSFTLGLTGAIYGGRPVNQLIESQGWLPVAFGLSLFAIVLGCSIFLLLRSKPVPANKQAEPCFNRQQFKALLKSPVIWLLALANFMMVGSLEGFADVWGVSYLMTAYHFSKNQAAELMSFIFVGMLAGGPLLALLARRLGNFSVIALSGLGMAAALFWLLSITTLTAFELKLLLFFVGMLCCYQVIVFSAGSELVKPELLGVSVAFLNCINMLGGSFFHTLIGRLMEHEAITQSGKTVYSLNAYQSALSLIPFCALLGVALIAGLAYRISRAVKLQTAAQVL